MFFRKSHSSHSSNHPSASSPDATNHELKNRPSPVSVTMNRLRKSFRESFRRKKDRIPESSKPHQWEEDERAVRSGECSFPVKYLGCVEVFDSRGMNVCDEALKILRSSRRRPLKGILFVTGDGLRVVDDEKKGLIVDQTIEKVSFCAPDRNHEKGFSYICRDGTTRRWMCHGFHAAKDSGDRLSHAVGCAFAVCLEKKQKRDRENNPGNTPSSANGITSSGTSFNITNTTTSSSGSSNVTMTFDKATSAFTRNGSFRQSTLTERLKDPQVAKTVAPPPLKPVHNPFAIERPHATPQLLERQGSFRGFTGLSQASPFKRQLSLRLSELPSNLERNRAQSLESNDLMPPPPPPPQIPPNATPFLPGTSSNLMPYQSSNVATSLPTVSGQPPSQPRLNGSVVAPVPLNLGPLFASSEHKMMGSTVDGPPDSISQMCKELSKGLQLLTNVEDSSLSSSNSVSTALSKGSTPIASTQPLSRSSSTNNNNNSNFATSFNTPPIPPPIVAPAVNMHKRIPPLSRQIRSQSFQANFSSSAPSTNPTSPNPTPFNGSFQSHPPNPLMANSLSTSCTPSRVPPPPPLVMNLESTASSSISGPNPLSHLKTRLMKTVSVDQVTGSKFGPISNDPFDVDWVKMIPSLNSPSTVGMETSSVNTNESMASPEILSPSNGHSSSESNPFSPTSPTGVVASFEVQM